MLMTVPDAEISSLICVPDSKDQPNVNVETASVRLCDCQGPSFVGKDDDGQECRREGDTLAVAVRTIVVMVSLIGHLASLAIR